MGGGGGYIIHKPSSLALAPAPTACPWSPASITAPFPEGRGKQAFFLVWEPQLSTTDKLVNQSTTLAADTQPSKQVGSSRRLSHSSKCYRVLLVSLISFNGF